MTEVNVFQRMVVIMLVQCGVEKFIHGHLTSRLRSNLILKCKRKKKTSKQSSSVKQKQSSTKKSGSYKEGSKKAGVKVKIEGEDKKGKDNKVPPQKELLQNAIALRKSSGLRHIMTILQTRERNIQLGFP